MKVILQENIAGLGKVGDHVAVKPGYARNYLVPKDKAVVANKTNIVDFEARREVLEQASVERISEAKDRVATVENVSISIEAQATDEGKLFGSIGPREIAQALIEAGVETKKSEVILAEGPIRVVGEHSVTIRLHSEVCVEIQVTVVAKVA